MMTDEPKIFIVSEFEDELGQKLEQSGSCIYNIGTKDAKSQKLLTLLSFNEKKKIFNDTCNL